MTSAFALSIIFSDDLQKIHKIMTFLFQVFMSWFPGKAGYSTTPNIESIVSFSPLVVYEILETVLDNIDFWGTF